MIEPFRKDEANHEEPCFVNHGSNPTFRVYFILNEIRSITCVVRKELHLRTNKSIFSAFLSFVTSLFMALECAAYSPLSRHTELPARERYAATSRARPKGRLEAREFHEIEEKTFVDNIIHNLLTWKGSMWRHNNWERLWSNKCRRKCLRYFLYEEEIAYLKLLSGRT